MEPIRTKALSTRLMLLLEVHNHRHAKLKTLADRLDISVQAVSDYLKRLSNDELVEFQDGAWKPTKRGTAYLHQTMRGLRKFLDESMGSLRIIDETFALAADRIHADDEVGLLMKDGRLHASARAKSRSRGRARTEADAGQLLLVGDLKGMVELAPAPITFLAHPDFPTGPSLERARREAKRLNSTPQRLLVATHDLSSLAWAWALGLEVDLEFTPLAAAQDAAQRGVPVLYLVSHRDLPSCLATLQSSTLPGGSPIPVRSVSL